MRARSLLATSALWCLSACGGCPPTLPSGWFLVRAREPGALLSVQAKDGVVWTSGGDPDGVAGPATATLLVDGDAFDDVDFVAIETGLQGDLWWVEPVTATVALAGGSFGRVVRVDRAPSPATVTPLPTPADGLNDPDLIVFGVFAADGEGDVWAVGGRNGGLTGGFVWRSRAGGPFVEVPLPATDVESYALWKVDGSGPQDVWIVGTGGLAFRSTDGETLVAIPTGLNTSLFTVDVDVDGALAVGGVGRGLAMTRGASDSAWTDVTPEGDETPPLLGVHRRDGAGCVVGVGGAAYSVSGATFAREAFGFAMFASLHACHVDEDGLIWAVGGQLTGLPLTGGVLLRKAP